MRRLKEEELVKLKKEFVSYLIMNGLDAEEWEKVKKKEPSKAEKVIDDFSFQYFEVMLNGIHFATFRDSNVVHAIHCKSDEYTEFVVLENNGEQKIAHRSQMYSQGRDQYLFNKLEEGFIPDNGDLFKEIALLFAQNN